MKAMLAKENIDREHIKKYMQDENYFFQPKHDGHRVLCKLGGGEVQALNRNGKPSQHQETMAELLEEYANTYDEPGSVIFDGELVNYDTYIVFDLPKLEEVVDIDTPYESRLEALKGIIQPSKSLYTVVNCIIPKQKSNLIQVIDDMDGEGIIIRSATSKYIPGKRSDNIIKCKFYKTVDLVVTATEVDGKEKFNFGAYDGDELVEIGGTKQIYEVAVGDVIELRYLSNSGDHPPKLTQPVLMRRREDKAPNECTFDQF